MQVRRGPTAYPLQVVKMDQTGEAAKKRAERLVAGPVLDKAWCVEFSQHRLLAGILDDARVSPCTRRLPAGGHPRPPPTSLRPSPPSSRLSPPPCPPSIRALRPEDPATLAQPESGCGEQVTFEHDLNRILDEKGIKLPSERKAYLLENMLAVPTCPPPLPPLSNPGARFQRPPSAL